MQESKMQEYKKLKGQQNNILVPSTLESSLYDLHHLGQSKTGLVTWYDQNQKEQQKLYVRIDIALIPWYKLLRMFGGYKEDWDYQEVPGRTTESTGS